MFRRALRDSFLYAGAGVAAGALALGLLPLYTRLLTRAEFGMIDLLAVFATWIHVTVALEVSQGVARFVPEAAAEDDRAAYASTGLWFTVLTYSVFALAAAALCDRLVPLLLGPEGSRGLLLAGLGAVLSHGIYYFGLGHLRCTLQPGRHAAVRALHALVANGSAAWLVAGCGWGATGVLAGQIGGNLVGSGMAWWWTRNSIRLTFDGRKLRQMLTFSAPLIASSVGVVVSLYMDRLAVRHLLGLAELGVYGVGWRIASMVSVILVGFQGAVTPLVYAHHREPATPAALARLFRYFVFAALLAVAGLGIFSTELLALLATPEYAPAACLVPLLAAASILNGMYIFAPGLAIARLSRRVALISVAAAGLNAALNLLLIPWIGLPGAAAATLVAALASFGMSMHAGQALYRVPHEWRRILRPLVVTCLAVLMGAWVSGAMSLSAPGTMVLKLAVLAGAGACACADLLDRATLVVAWRQARFTRIRQIPLPENR